jgi:hypothetical protein
MRFDLAFAADAAGTERAAAMRRKLSDDRISA